MPVAVMGTDEFDVTQIDPATIVLGREGIEVGVQLLRWAYEDMATPFEGELCDCHTLGPFVSPALLFRTLLTFHLRLF